MFFVSGDGFTGATFAVVMNLLFWLGLVWGTLAGLNHFGVI